MSIKIINHKVNFFALVDPLLGRITGLFIPIANGKRESNVVLSSVFSEQEIRVNIEQGLDYSDQSILFSLIALAGIDGKIINENSKGPRSTYLWSNLNAMYNAASENAILLSTTQAKIISVLGWNKSGHEYDRLKEGLDRLSKVDLHLISEGYEWKSSMLSYLISKNDIGREDVVDVVVNPRIARAIDGGQFNRICLEERKQLKSNNVAMLVHAWLSSNINPGEVLTPFLDTLVQRIWNTDKCQSNTTALTAYEKKEIRRKRGMMVDALRDIAELRGWQVELIGNGATGKATVRRPRVFKGVVKEV
ncbi:replication protein C, IncQ-type [Aeromonas allosaccharophila]